MVNSVVVAIAVQLYYINKVGQHDSPSKDWHNILSSQIVQNLSIITACVPYLKPLLESLESGMIRSDDLRRRGKDGEYLSGSYRLDESDPKSGSRDTANSNNVVRLGPGRGNVVITGGKSQSPEWDQDSQKSCAHMIKETRTWTVE